MRRERQRKPMPFVGIPVPVFRSESYRGLSANAVRLLYELRAQYRGRNNGDLCASWTLMKDRGFKSKGTLHRAKIELLQAGIVIVSRKGGRNRAELLALTFEPIDDIAKLDVSPTKTASNLWRKK